MTVADLFEKHSREYAKFERIPEDRRRSPMPDVCAMLYLHERFGPPRYPMTGNVKDAVDFAEHDIIGLAWDARFLSEDDVIYLARCGVHFDDEFEGLCLFV